MALPISSSFHLPQRTGATGSYLPACTRSLPSHLPLAHSQRGPMLSMSHSTSDRGMRSSWTPTNTRSSCFMLSFDLRDGCLNSISRHRQRRGHPVTCTAAADDSAPSNAAPLIPLGSSSLRVSPIAVGTLQWGDPGSGFGERYGEGDLEEAYRTLTAGGINFFDTAEVYGYQNIASGCSSEQLLGKFVRQDKDKAEKDKKPPAVVGTKFFTIPWTNLLVGGGFRLGRQSLIAALEESNRRLGVETVDLYQIHFPFPTLSNRVLMEGLREAVDRQLATAVGVSNYNKQQMQEAFDLLAAAGIPLASNQVRFSLLSREAEASGLLDTCKDLQVSLIAYSPLASGLLSDSAVGRKDAAKLTSLLSAMKSVGEAHGGKTISQVAVNYVKAKGAIPIPGCKSAQQAALHVDCLSWSLTQEDVQLLELRSKL